MYKRQSLYRSPGWSRLKQNSDNKPSIFLNKNRTSLKDFSVGQRVFHEKFGYGSILSLEADKAVVDFEKSDQKNIKTGFLTHEKDV